MLAAAEVALLMLAVAAIAQRSLLAERPLLAWQAIFRVAQIAKTAGPDAAIDAMPVERLLVTDREHLHELTSQFRFARARSGPTRLSNNCYGVCI